ncbi:MAG: hypothetical protein AAF600_19905 [Bacteroidota bacterium]
MRFLLIGCLTLLSLGCNQSLYYEYVENESYSTIEIKPKEGRVIYRAISEPHYNPFYTPPNSTDSISSGKILSLTDATYVVIDSYFQRTDSLISLNRSFFSNYVKHHGDKHYKVCHANKVHDVDADNFVEYQRVKDGLILMEPEKAKELLNEDNSCFTLNKVTWLPPYFKKTNKIHYNHYVKATGLDWYVIRRPENHLD